MIFYTLLILFVVLLIWSLIDLGYITVYGILIFIGLLFAIFILIACDMAFWHPEAYDKARRTAELYESQKKQKKKRELSDMEKFIDRVETYHAMVDDD